MHTQRQIRHRLALVTLLILLGFTRLDAQTPVSQDLLVDPFTGPASQAPVMRLDVATPGYPCLTAAAGQNPASSTIPTCALAQPDADGQGALRFTPATEGTASAIISTQHLPTTKGLRISFVQYQWGGYGIGGPGNPGGGDGIALFLAVAPPLPAFLGPQGGALGYASEGDTPGLPGGWLGIGLDAFGSFSNPDWFGSSSCPVLSWTPAGDQITVRGPEHIGYCVLSSSIENGGLPDGVSLRGDSRAASKRRVEVVIDPVAGTYTVSMDPTGGTDFQPVTWGPLPTDYSDPTNGDVIAGLPPRITFGFSASTGSATDFHEIADVSVTTLDGTVPVLGLTKTNTLSQSPQPGDTFEYVLTPTVSVADEAATIRVEDTLPAEVLLNATINATDWDCGTGDQNGRTTLTCSYSGSYPVAADTTLPAIHVPVAVQNSVALGTSFTNTASVASDDAAAVVAASNVVIALPAVTIDSGGLTPGGPGNTFSLPGGTVGVPYSASMSATGIGAVTWSLASSNLPDGLSLNPDGSIAGTPGTSGVSTFVLRATDSTGAFASIALAITIAPAGPTLSINTDGLPAGPGGTFALPAGTVNVVYSAALGATGGTGAITWALDSGALPAGLTLNPNGTVTGTPTAAGTASFVARATDTLNASVTVPLSIVVAPAPIVVNTGGLPAGPGGTFALPGGTVNVVYSTALNATGGTGAISWTLDSGALPAGLTLNPNGTVTGTPTTAGTASFVARATDTLNASVTVPLSIGIAPAPIVVNTGGLPAGPGGTFALPGGTVNVVYSAALAATGGTGAISWTLDSGALPAGLTLNPNGTVTGTPTAAGTASFVARATDTLNASVTVPLSIVVAPAPIVVNTGGLPAGPGGTFALPGGTVNVVYSAALAATGGTGAISWTLDSGALPAGLTLNPNGTVTGTPTTAGTASFVARATDTLNASVTVPLSIVVAPAPIVVNTGGLPAGPGGTFALPGGTVNVVYSAALAATGGTGAISWTLDSGALPAGLTLNPNGTVTGTPTAAGTASFVARATDTLNASVTVPLSIVVAPAPIVVNTGGLPAGPGGTFALPGGTVNVVYSAALAATGGTGAISWTLDSGALPAGLTLNPNGTVTGTPTAAGTASFVARATDTLNASVTVPLSIVVAPAPIVVNTGGLPAGPGGTFALPGGTVNVVYSAALAATGGTGAITWALDSGALPAGLTLNPNGTVTGTPTAAGTASFVARATDTVNGSVTVPLSIVVAPAPIVVNTGGLPAGPGGTFALPGGTVNVVYSTALNATGGTGAISWTLDSGALPAGLTLNPNGTVTGTPTAAGTASFVARATDTLNASVTVPLSIVIAPGTAAPLVIVTTSLPGGSPGVPYDATLVATGGSGPITWSVTLGNLPAGLTLSAAGQITGVPTTAGSPRFQVTARSGGARVNRLFVIAVRTERLVIRTTSVPSARVGVPYQLTMNATGGQTPYRWRLAYGTLPAGLSLSTGGLLSGTPSTAVPFGRPFGISVTDAAGQTAQVNLNLLVSDIRFTTTSLSDGMLQQSYFAMASVTGFIGQATMRIESGALPPGLTLGAMSGACGCARIAGTPTAAGTFTITISATDSGGFSAVRTFSIRILPGSITILGPQFAPVYGGTPFSAQYGIYPRSTGVQWTLVSGSLPPGLTLSPTGLVSGTAATIPGVFVTTYQCSIRAVDIYGRVAEMRLTFSVINLAALGG